MEKIRRKGSAMHKESRIKIVRWIARVWSILVLIFALVLLISTLSEMGSDPPSLIFWVLFGLWFAAVLALVAAWRWELAGGIIAITALVSREMMYFFLSYQIFVEFWMVWLPVLPPAILFIIAQLEGRRLEAAKRPKEVFD
jgi:hypothetical protein